MGDHPTMPPSPRTLRVASWLLAVPVGAFGSLALIVLVIAGVNLLFPECGPMRVQTGSHFGAIAQPTESPVWGLIEWGWSALILAAWLFVWWRLSRWLRHYMLDGRTGTNVDGAPRRGSAG